jgi:hypothetical protein
MNDNAVLDKNPVPAPVSGNAVSSVGSINKEASPINLNLGSPELKSAEPESQHDIDQELTQIEVKEVKDNPDLTSEHEELGVKHAGPFVPVPPLSDKVVMPMSEEEITAKIKTGQDDESGKSLAKLLQKIIDWGLRRQ